MSKNKVKIEMLKLVSLLRPPHQVRGSRNDTLSCRQVGIIHYLLFAFFIFNFSFFCFAQNKFIYDAKGKRNPFIPLITADGRLLKLDVEEAKGGLAIEGIIYDEQGISYAIVNGSVVKAGDVVDNAQVLRVEKDKVVVIKEGKELELELLKTSKDIE